VASLFSELGINAPALIAQAVNFGVVILVLTFLVYRPLSRLMNERSKKIAEGLASYELGRERLAQIEIERAKKLSMAEEEAMRMVKLAEDSAREREREILAQTNARSEGMLKQTRTIIERTKQEGMRNFEKEAVRFVKDILVETVKLDPKAVHENLIREAIANVRKL
jgi:F-type H+-transporting ATPase subunit b